jgi:signal transduction histidine kinase
MTKIRTRLSGSAIAIDAAIAVVLTLLSLFAVGAGAPDIGASGPLNLVLLLLQSVPLVVRRFFPIPVLLVIAGALLAQVALLPPGAELRGALGLLVALYTVGERLERRVSLPLTVLVGIAIGVSMVGHIGLPESLQGLIQTELFFLASWFVGDGVRIRRLYTRMLEEKASMLEHAREEEGKRAIAEERQRIARELHDAVTHHVSVVVIQAGAALRALEKRPADVRAALEAIDATGRTALTDMRRMLGILGDGKTQGEMPGLDRLGDLIEQVRAAGLAVELSVEGDRRPLDAGLELSAYRIIQEALTNSLKHAAGGRAHVTIRYEPESLAIAIDDERGSGEAAEVEPSHQGRGLLGMRERVAMFRGSFIAQPTGSGFRVQARLPVDPASGAS